MCLLCSDKVALVKSSSVKRHYETKHKTRYDAQNPNIASVAKTLLTIFGSTYICELCCLHEMHFVVSDL